jgi:riboflavin kinase/FMN adenylyltransferase
VLGRHAGLIAPRPWWGAHAARPLVIECLDDVGRRARRVAIGNFDGVHRGQAAITAGCDAVLTFDPHPMTVLAPARDPRLLTDLATKARLVAELGGAELVVLPFDLDPARQSAPGFVEEVLVGHLGAIHVSVGVNFRYGARARGDVASLRACQQFTTTAAALVRVGGEVVSSTGIRDALAAGDIGEATRLLGRPHRLTGAIRADHRGGRGAARTTARVALDGSVIAPPAGWYVCTLATPGIGCEPVKATLCIDDRPGAGLLWAQERLEAGEVVIELVRAASARDVPAGLGPPAVRADAGWPHGSGGAGAPTHRGAAASAGAADGQCSYIAPR